MNFTIPSDYNVKTIEKLLEISKKYKNRNIYEVYGNLNGISPISSGRGYLESSNIGIDTLKEYVSFLNEKNIYMNYTINASCTNNIELEPTGQKEIIKIMDLLMKMGVTKYTVASTSLAQFLKYIYKDDINITLSTIANIDSVRRAKFAQTIGVDTIVLGEDETRNFSLIEQIHKEVKCKMEIIVNSMCLWNCIYRQSHYNCLAHCSNSKSSKVTFFTNQCSMINKCNMEESIKTPWIRPEDMALYEDKGVDLFKFIGREIVKEADWAKMFEIYCLGEYDGNLLELLNAFSGTSELYIDNKSLDGFINYFVNNQFRCKEICGTDRCSYCKFYFEKAKRR